MLKYQYLFLDLDGTLLSKYKRIRKSNYLALSKYYNAGGKIVIATGKFISGALHYAQLIEKHARVKISYVIALNGSVIIDAQTKEVLWSETLSVDDAKKIYQIAEQRKVCFWPYTLDGAKNSYVPIIGFKLKKIISWFNIGLKIVKYNPELHDLTSYKVNIINNSFFGFKKIQAALKDAREQLSHLHISDTSKWLFEVNGLNATKGHGVDFIAKRENVSTDKFAAMGDSANDVSMLKSVGLPIAVYHKHKHNVIKPYVKITIKNSRYTHVAAAIERYLLNKK